MATPLRVLVLEDRPDDVELMAHELRRAGFDPDWQCVETKPDYLAHLDPALDVILADYTLPQFDALRALHLLQERGLDIPFIVVTGSISEEVAVECMKQGAADYLLKDRLARLGQAVTRVLEDKQLRVERKQAEEALRASEERFRRLVESVTDYIYTVKIEAGRPVATSHGPGCATVTGYTPEEYAADPHLWYRMVHEQDRQAVTEQAAKALSGEAALPLEHRIIHKDGSIRWVRNTPVLRRDDQGRLVAYDGLIADITERKRAEEALRESQARYRTLVEQIPAIVYLDAIDETSSAIYISPQVEAMSGYSPEEWTTDPELWPKLLHPDDRERVLAEHARTNATGETFALEYRLVARDGRVVWIRDEAMMVRDSAGRPLCWQGIMLDITGRKRAEAQLERNLRETHVRFEVSQALAGKETEDEVLDVLIQHAGLYRQAFVVIFTFDRTGGELTIILRRHNPFESGVVTLAPIGTRFSASRFTSLNIYPADQPFVSDNVFTDERIDPASRELFRELKAISFATFPLTVGNEWMGIIFVLAKPAGYFDEEKQHLYQTLAEQGAVALRAARLRATIRESRQRLSLLVQQSPLAVIEWNTDLQVVSWNPAAERIFGYTGEEALGRHAAGLIEPEEALPRLDQGWQAVLAQKGGTHSTRDNLTKDGRPITCEWFNALLVGADGKAIGVASLVEDITQRKRAEERLAYQAHLLANVHDAIIAIDEKLDVTAWNRAAEEMYGWKAEEVLGRNVIGVLRSGSTEARLAALLRTLNETGRSRAEGVHHRKDGQPIHVEGTFTALYGADGRITGYAIVNRDITERKRAEDLMHTQRDLAVALGAASGLAEGLRVCFEAALNVSEMDCGGIYLVDEASGASDLVFHRGLLPDFVRSVSHYEADSANVRLVMLGKPIYTEHLQLGVPLSEAERREGLGAIAVLPFRHEDRVIGCLNVASHTLEAIPIFARDALEAIAAQMGSVVARLKSEEALQASEAHYRELADSIADVFFAMDKDLRYTYWNTASENLTGISARDAIGKSLLEVFPDTPEIRSMEKAYRDILRTQQHQTFVNDTDLGGRRYFFEISAYPSQRGISVFVKDITERKQADEALRASLAEKEVLLKEVYHRVKNNLTAIIGLINLHEAGAADPATVALLVELEGRIRTMAQVHESLYQSKDLGHINFQDYLETLIAQLCASLAPRPDVRCRVEAAGVEMGLDTAIPCGLIVNELITNAFKHAFPGGQPRPGEKACEITISAQWDGSAGDGGDYTLVVADNGVGLPADLDWAATKTLGLRLVRLLVQLQLAGQVNLDRVGGTQFTLKFASRHRR